MSLNFFCMINFAVSIRMTSFNLAYNRLSGSGISTNRFVPSVLTSRRIQFVRCYQSQNQAVDRELQTLRAEHHHPNVDVFAASANRKVTTSDHAQRKSLLIHKLFLCCIYSAGRKDTSGHNQRDFSST